MGRALRIDTVRSAGKDDPDGIIGPDLFQRHRPRMHFAVDTAGSHPPCDQLIILPAEIQNQYLLNILNIQIRLPPYLCFSGFC